MDTTFLINYENNFPNKNIKLIHIMPKMDKKVFRIRVATILTWYDFFKLI